MSLLVDFNAKSATQYLPRVQLQELTNPLGHKVQAFRELETKFGRAVLATVEMADGLKEVFLPKRFTDVLNADKISSYNAVPNLKILFKGTGKFGEKIIELCE
uniref:Uncharacterized protein n=1 Tax=Graphocephala atropunctata TaxID=36148 RepID=A0A1B6LCL8_9HEMI